MEHEAMGNNILDSLAVVITCLSYSPCGAKFLFVGKKDGTLRPCIDHREVNNIKIRDKYKHTNTHRGHIEYLQPDEQTQQSSRTW